jgi:hypothetical protein
VAIMMKTRRRRPQRLRSGQKCRSSKITHSGGKRSPEDLLTRPERFGPAAIYQFYNIYIWWWWVIVNCCICDKDKDNNDHITGLAEL